MAKKKTTESIQEEKEKKSFFSRMKITKQHKVLFGFLLILFSIALFFAFISFFVYWREDQSSLGTLTERSIPVKNWLGKFGAELSHFFIYGTFGIASFLFVRLFMITGIYLVMSMPVSKLRNSWFWDLFALLILSISFGFFFNYIPELSGVIGFELNDYMQDYLGKIGTFLILLFGFLIFLIFRLQISPETIQTFFENRRSDIKEELNDFEKDSNPFSNEENHQKHDNHETMVEGANSIKNPKPSQFEVDKTALKPTIQKASELSWKVNNNPNANEISLQIENNHSEDDLIPNNINTHDNLDDEDDIIIEIKPSETEIEGDFIIQEAVQEATLEENLSERLVADFGEFDPTLELSNYRFPTIDLLKDHSSGGITINQEELEENKNKIVETLKNYKIEIAQIKATVGPSVTLYEIIPEAGIRISKIKNLEDDIALSLSALGIRIIAPIPGKGTIGIEVPNKKPTTVSMRAVIGSAKFQEAEMELPIALGKTISNETFVVDLAKMPHLLMAGATGQGKSVGLNAVLTSLLYKKHPAEVKFVLVDPKKVELTLFNKIERHYLAKLPNSDDAIITDNAKVINTLNSLCIEMDNRYSLLKDAMVRNIKEYNDKFKARRLNPELGHRFLPYIVLVVDEFADLIMTAGKEVETPIARLAQLARAIGIHLIIATQRPSVNVITGIIKANFPARIAFRVTSKIDSRTILDTQGADQLIGRGDLLYTNGNDVVRVQCAFVDTPEVEKITEFIGNQKAYPDAYLLPEFVGEEGSANLEFDISERDSLFKDAAEVIVTAQQGSASLLQRKLKLGYNRAGRLIDQLEAAGIVGAFEGSKARSVNIPDLSSLEEFFRNEQK
jgi:DNA segregation ATPase FtsK/SpoIIIE, S-DNA-T family